MFYRSMKTAFNQQHKNFFFVFIIVDGAYTLRVVKSDIQLPNMVEYINCVPCSSTSFVRSMTKIAMNTRRVVGNCVMMNYTTFLQVIDLFDWDFMYFALSRKIDIVIDEDLLPGDVFITILSKYDSPFSVADNIYLHPDLRNRIIRLSTNDDLKLCG